MRFELSSSLKENFLTTCTPIALQEEMYSLGIIRITIDSQNTTTSCVLTVNCNPNYTSNTTGMNHLKIVLIGVCFFITKL